MEPDEHQGTDHVGIHPIRVLLLTVNTQSCMYSVQYLPGNHMCS
jgi:hypothetical protein